MLANTTEDIRNAITDTVYTFRAAGYNVKPNVKTTKQYFAKLSLHNLWKLNFKTVVFREVNVQCTPTKSIYGNQFDATNTLG